jgi:PAS domain-containing protein
MGLVSASCPTRAGRPAVNGESPPCAPVAAVLAALLDALPDGVVAVDRQARVVYVNRAGAGLLQRQVTELVGQNLWAALPELTGTTLHGFLLRARGATEQVTWTGFYPPAGRWLSATASAADGLLRVSLRLAAESPAAVDATGTDAETSIGLDPKRLRYLAEVSESLITTLDTGETATRLAQLATAQLCDWAVVALVDETGDVGEQAWAHRDPQLRADLDTYMTGRLRGTGDGGAMIDALMTGQPVRVPAVQQEVIAPSLPNKAIRRAWQRLNATSFTLVPLRARNTTFGALALINSDDRPAHTDEQIATAVEVARRGALSLDNARLYGRQQAVAETLQRSLLTDPPQPDDLELAVRYRPASSHLHVGGDWYDAFQQPGGATMLVIGDVVGHDVDAAAAMGQIRSILRGIAYDRPDTPARVLSRVDAVLAGLRLGKLRWSSAGHLPPLRIRSDRTVEILGSPPQRLLGTDHPGPRSNHEVELHPEDTVLLYTDGLVEHGRTGLDEGIAQLAAAAGALAGLPVDQLCDQLIAQLLPDHADDDVALLAVRCHPQHPGE